MILSMGKKLVLLSCLVSGVILGMNLGEDNCVVVPVKEWVWGVEGTVNTILFYDKHISGKMLFHTDFFDRPIASTDWDKETRGVLHINFEDGNKLQIDVNKPLKTE